MEGLGEEMTKSTEKKGQDGLEEEVASILQKFNGEEGTNKEKETGVEKLSKVEDKENKRLEIDN